MSSWSCSIKYCVLYGNYDIIDFSDFDDIFFKNDITFITDNGNHIIHFLAICESTSLLNHILPHIKKYINLKNKLNETPLQIACYSGSLKTVKILLNNGANWLIKDDDKNNILHLAVIADNYELVKYLVKTKSLTIEDRNIYNMTPLGTACYEENIKIAKYLLKNKANIDTLLFYYVKQNNYNIIKLLLPFIKTNKTILFDNKNRSILYYATKHKEILKLFFQYNISQYINQQRINNDTLNNTLESNTI